MSKSTSKKQVTITYTLTEWEAAVLDGERQYMGDCLPRMTREEYAVYALRHAIYGLYESFLGELGGWMPAGDPPAGADVHTVLYQAQQERKRRRSPRRQARAKVER